jgi:Uma2 family endonuclease
MAQAPPKPLTFEEFAALGLDGAYELVNGNLEELVPFSTLHAWTGGRIFRELDPYFEARDPEGYWGVELDIPTIPFFGRRPDFVYYSAADAASNIDWAARRAVGPPTLVVEVLSEDDEERDLVTKREEYARAGIPHYWILDPQRRTALTLALRDGRYEVAGEFEGDAVLTSELFPGLEVPLRRLFR